MTTEHNSQDNWQDFWDTSDTVFENYDEQHLLNQLNGSDVTLRNDKYNGFDNNSGDSWIYPTNYPVRKYQHDIVYNALFKNTLVVLPTGLGKTFIAAVVMYNFYRWYPQGKIIFMAPTRPLVAQQMNACYQIMGISKQDTADITGQQKKELRIQRWKLQRVFFATPQSVVSDLDDINFPIQSVKLIVVDEAHKAKGRHAYCDVIRLVSAKNKMFRVLALSATPGRKTDDVAEVVHNLLISHIEMRTEKCSDVAPYTHTKQIETILVRLNDNVRQYRDELLDIIDPYVRNLVDFDVITGTLHNLNKGWLMFQKQKYESNTLVQKHPHHSAVQTNFACCICLYHALELLERHGLWPFINYFNSSDEKFVVAKDHRLKQFLNTVRQKMGAFPFTSNAVVVADAPVIPVDFDFGHPKYDELQKCLIKHLSNTVRSQAIVFCEYRDSAFLIHQSLLRKQPIIKPAIFIGQGSTTNLKGITQKQQIATMADFRQGIYNVLIATCVAEEGIDCGEVDLIICFDVSSKNPIRLVQRMGRTGRKRNGKVIMLVSEGKEQKNLTDTLAGKDSTNKKILSNPDVLNSLCRSSRLIPSEFDPKCVETFIKSDEISDVKAKSAKSRKSKTTNNEEDIPSEMTSIKSSKKQQPCTPTNLRNFFQTMDIDGESQAKSIRKEDSIRSHRTSQVTIVEANDNLKIPTFWEVIRNSTTPNALVAFAVKRNVNVWKEKLENNSLSDVEMSAISKVLGDQRNIHVLGGEDSLYNNKKMPIMDEFDDRSEKQDPSFMMKLIDRLMQVKRAQKMQESQEKAVCIQERNSDTIDVSVHNETDEELANLQMSYEVDSKYETPKRLKQLTLLNYSSPLKRKQNPIQSSTPLPTAKKQMAKRNNSVVDSPLKRAFERSLNKSLKEKKQKTSNVLEFFGFTDILDLFDDETTPSIANTLPEPENTVDLLGNTLHSSENEKDNRDICTRTPLAVISNQEPQEYTVSQILKMVKVSKTNVNNQDVNQATTSQSSLKENMLSRYADKEAKAFDIGNIDDIFDADFDYIETHQKSQCSGKKTEEEDIIASSQSVIFNSKPLNTFKNLENGSKSTLTKLSFPTGDDMFASFSTTSSSISSPLTLKKVSTPSTIKPDHSIPAVKPICPESHSVPSNSTTKLKKTPTSTNELLSKIDRSPSMFNRKVNLSRLSSRSQINRSNCLPSRSPLFHSCGNLRNEDNNNVRLSSLEADANDCASQIDKGFKIHRNAKRNYVIDDTILALSQEKDASVLNKVVERISKKPKKPFRKFNFIQDECDASDGSTDEDENISDFIGDSIICNDDDVHDDTAVDMKAMYLQSTKSPVKKNGFRLPDPRKYLNNNIFSQTVVQEDDSDYDESFVVDENEEDEEVDQEMTVLERAELILKMRRKEKRKMSKNILVSAPKRRKIIVAEDSSDENE